MITTVLQVLVITALVMRHVFAFSKFSYPVNAWYYIVAKKPTNKRPVVFPDLEQDKESSYFTRGIKVQAHEKMVNSNWVLAGNILNGRFDCLTNELLINLFPKTQPA